MIVSMAFVAARWSVSRSLHVGGRGRVCHPHCGGTAGGTYGPGGTKTQLPHPTDGHGAIYRGLISVFVDHVISELTACHTLVRERFSRKTLR